MTASRPREKKQRLYVHGLMCEDVRDEVAGGASFIGVFKGRIILDQIPTTILKLSLVVWVSWPTGDPQPSTIATGLILPDDTELNSGNQLIPRVAEPEIEDRRQELTSVMRCLMVPITKERAIRAYVDLDGRRYRIASLKISVVSSAFGTADASRTAIPTP